MPCRAAQLCAEPRKAAFHIPCAIRSCAIRADARSRRLASEGSKPRSRLQEIPGHVALQLTHAHAALLWAFGTASFSRKRVPTFPQAALVRMRFWFHKGACGLCEMPFSRNSIGARLMQSGAIPACSAMVPPSLIAESAPLGPISAPVSATVHPSRSNHAERGKRIILRCFAPVEIFRRGTWMNGRLRISSSRGFQAPLSASFSRNFCFFISAR